MIDGFKILREFNSYFCVSTYHPKEIRDRIIAQFKWEWAKLHKMYGTTYTLKVHIILAHVNDYVQMVEGGLSKRGNDQVTEVAHQLLKARMDKSNYWIKKSSL